MNDLGVIDRFLDTFSRYIDSGFGLLQPEVAYLASTLIAIDITLAGLFWAMGGDEVMPRLIKKVLYIGAFAFIIGNFNYLAGVIFKSFAGLGLKASAASIGADQLLQPGRLAQVGVTAGQPMLDEIGKLAGFPSVFTNIDTILVLFVAWLLVIIAFFILAIQLFVSVLEFKLTTLAGFILVPFALWGRTSFLAEKVLGNVVASGIKILVLAVIVGIGTGLFSQFQSAPGTDPDISTALSIVLGALAMVGLGIFGPGIATGLVSGAPQLGAGAAVGATAAGAGLLAAGGMGAVAAGRLAGGAALGGARSATSLAGGARAAYGAAAAESGASGMARAGAGMAGMARAGASATGDAIKSTAQRLWRGGSPGTESGAGGEAGSGVEPGWARRMRRGETIRRGVETSAHVLRSGDHGGSGQGPTLGEES